MTNADVLVVGGGPAGSMCATRLVRGGLDVVVLDRAAFPRDKVCAGWITPAVVQLSELDLTDYAADHTLQPFTGFRTGPFDRETLLTAYDQPISYGIRRCEFDAYMLRRSGAQVISGQPLDTLRRESGDWIANDSIRARVVIGAGGHFCPVARQLNPRTSHEPVVVAQEVEFQVEAGPDEADGIRGEWPELFFWPDLLGYGWCVRKGNYVNIGAGRLGSSAFPAAVEEFKGFLRERGLASAAARPWKGHAYLLNRTSRRRVTGDGVALVGDAAGLALAPSGEGILAAVESGVMAADAVLEAFSAGSPHDLSKHGDRLAARFGPRASGSSGTTWPAWLGRLASAAILRSRWMTRRYLIEDAFLHQRRIPLATRAAEA